MGLLVGRGRATGWAHPVVPCPLPGLWTAGVVNLAAVGWRGLLRKKEERKGQ